MELTRRLSDRLKYWLFMGLGLVCFAANLAAQTSRDRDAFDRQVHATLKHWQAPGAVIAMVKDGTPVLISGYGTTRVMDGQPVTPNTLTSVASVTKPFTSFALGILVAEGTLSWDDPVKKHIPEFEFADAYRTEHTTIRDLITHRAGLPPIMGGLRSMEYTIERMLEELRDAPPRIAFRERLDYSQVGLALLGEIILRATGASWSEFVHQRILEPLGMKSTYAGTEAFLRAHSSPSDVSQLMGRALRKSGVMSDGPWQGVGHVYGPAGGLVTTAEDMARFLRFILVGRNRSTEPIFPDSIFQEIFSPQEVEASPYRTVVNPLTGLAAYCLGWITHEYDDSMIYEHPGSNFGSSVVAVMPSRGIGIFVSSNATFSLESDRMVSALKFATIDFALGRTSRDWISLMSGVR